MRSSGVKAVKVGCVVTAGALPCVVTVEVLVVMLTFVTMISAC